MLEVCCGSGASSRAMVTYMRRIGREGKSLLVDIMTLDVLLATYPELRPYLEDGSIVYFEVCLTQMRQGDLQLLVEGLLGIPWSKLHSYHVALACATWSWACLDQQETVQDSRGGCYRLRGSGCGKATRIDTEGGKRLAQNQRQGADHVRVAQARLV